jgi:sterol desaturase/sphingolipid hydroxylase (fatty acid hydroxylase superfamily)
VKVHHKVFHGIESYELEVVAKETVLSSFGEILRNILLYLPVAIAIFIKNNFLGILFLVVCIVYNLWEEFVHYYFHKKDEKLFVLKLKLFKKLKEHHRVHHYMYRYNFGIGTSFWDVLFKTSKKV